MAPMIPRRPNSLKGALTDVMGALTAEVCAELIGRTPSLVRRASNPEDETMLSMDAGARLDAAYQQATGLAGPIIPAMEALRDRLAGHRPRHEPANPLDRVTEVIKECAEAVEAYTASHPAESPNMRNMALQEVYELIEAAQAMARDLEAQDRTVQPLRAPAVAE